VSRRPEPWQPVLSGEKAQEAREVIREIADWLLEWLATPPVRPHANDLSGGSLARGRAGIALFFAYLAGARSVAGAVDVTSLLHESLEWAQARPSDLTLSLGASGVGWSAAHLLRMELVQGAEVRSIANTLSELDERLLRSLRSGAMSDNPELFFGLSGVGLYALERLPDSAAERLLESVVISMAAQADVDRYGVACRRVIDTPYLHGSLCTGMAHGIGGPIAVLARAFMLGVARPDAQRALRPSVTWLLAQRAAGDGSSTFPYSVPLDPARAPFPSWMGWCYGDLSLALPISAAAHALNEPAWANAGLEIARAGALRGLAQSGVEDGPLCHGTAGVAHIFGRLYQQFRDPDFADAARIWHARTLSLKRRADGLLGLGEVRRLAGGRVQRVRRPGLIPGLAGVGLSLLAATEPLEPSWDRCLLLDASATM